MRPLRTWLLYLSVVMAGGALLAPWLHWLVAETSAWIPALKPLAAKPFHRFVHRAMLGIALGGLWPVLRGLGLRSYQELGLTPAVGWSLACLVLVGSVRAHAILRSSSHPASNPDSA